MLNFLLIATVNLFLFVSIGRVVAEYEEASLFASDCVTADNLYKLDVDAAQVGFSVVAAAPQRYALYAVNEDCYECSPSFVVNGGSSMCGVMWTPFSWTFTIWDNEKQMIVPGSTLDFTIGEHGWYNVSATFLPGVNPVLSTINMVTVEEPLNSLTALWIWLFVIFLPVIILNFTGGKIARWIRRFYYKISSYFFTVSFPKASANDTVNADADLSTPMKTSSTAAGGGAKNSEGSFWEVLVSPTSAADSIWQDKPSVDRDNMNPVRGADRDAEKGSLNTPLISSRPNDTPGGEGIKFRGADTPNIITQSNNNKTGKKTQSSRVDCLDTFRGMCLQLMIFVNFGGGGYWFFDHAAWNGLTFADVLFPWFMWVMGCSMALSYRRLHTNEYRGTEDDAYARRQDQKLVAGDETLATTGDAGVSPKRYTVSTVQEGSSKGWSEIHSEPNSPVKMTPNNSQQDDTRNSQSALLEAANSPDIVHSKSKEATIAPNAEDPWVLWKRVLRRTCILFCLGLFLNNGYQVIATGHWRIPGVLQYFAISTIVVAGTVILMRKRTAKMLAEYEERMISTGKMEVENIPPACVPSAEKVGTTVGAWWDFRESVMYCYYYEYAVMIGIFFVYLIICLAGSAPGCPAGYNGPGGIANSGDDAACTGGIHRYIDMKLFGSKHIYSQPTCKSLYACQSYDPEGLLGSMTACTLSYFGLITGRILLHYPGHKHRLQRWLGLGCLLCFFAGCLCGFSQNDGIIPINKNLWSASFGLVTAGGGMIGLSLTYVFVDMYGLWTGAPFRYLGLNSILIFCGHEILQEYFPFEWEQNYPTHMSLMLMNVFGATLWALIARYCYSVKFFLKV
jgi:predicted acyltransferase